MKKNIKLKKSALTASAALMLAQSFTAQTLLAAEMSPQTHEQQTTENNSKGNFCQLNTDSNSKISQLVQQAKLGMSGKIPLIKLFNKALVTDLDLKMESKPSVGTKYAAIDKWKLEASLTHELMKNSKLFFDVSAEDSREVTFIQQLPSQGESICRLPYDPITRLPITTDSFIDKSGNDPKKFHVGDYVRYRAPLEFKISKEMNIIKDISKQFSLDINGEFYLRGEFIIEVFRLTKDQVRVKLSALDINGTKAELPLTLINVVSDKANFGAFALRKLYRLLFKSDLINLEVDSSQITQFFFDYIININTNEGKEVYNSFFGEKMNIRNYKENIFEHLKIANSFRSIDERYKIIASDIQKVNEAVERSRSLEVNDRPVINLISSNSFSTKDTTGLKISLLNLVRVSDELSQAVTDIKFIDNDTSTEDKSYRVDQLTHNTLNARVKVNESREEETSNLVTRTTDFDNNTTSNSFIGFKITQKIEEATISSSKYNFLQNKVNRLVPITLKEKFKLPNLDSNREYGITLNHEIYFTDSFLRLGQYLTPKLIEEKINEVLTSGKEFKARPMYINANDTENEDLKRLAAGIINDERDKNMYLEIYKSDIQTLASYGVNTQNPISKLSIIDLFANSKNPETHQIDINLFRQKLLIMSEKIPLFAEMMPYLFAKLVPEKLLAKMIFIKQEYTIRGEDTITKLFPESLPEPSIKKLKQLDNIIRATNYVVKRDFDIKDYYNLKGDILSIDDMINNTLIKITRPLTMDDLKN